MSGFLVNKSLLDPTVTQYSGGTASFTLPQSGSTNATEVFVGGVPQVAGVDLIVSGTALTLTTSAPAGSNMVCARQYFSDGITGTPAANSVATAAVQDNAINLAKMAGGTDGNIISFDASGDPVYIATGDDGQVLTSAGAGAQPAFETLSTGWTLGTEQATTSGTAFTFGSIPAGVKHIVVNFVGVSQGSANSRLIVRIGDAGGIETSGYLSTGVQLHLATVSGHGRITDAFNVSALSDFDAAKTVDGAAEFFLEDSSAFTWVMQSYLGCSDQDQSYLSAGSKSLSAELTQLVVTTAGGSTFDAGAVNIMYM